MSFFSKISCIMRDISWYSKYEILFFILYAVVVAVAVDCALIQPPDVKRLCMRYLSNNYEYEYEYEYEMSGCR